MMKIAGSILILTGGFLAWHRQMTERRHRRDTLREVVSALRRMGEELRMARPPMTWLLERAAGECGGEAGCFFAAGAAALRRGEGLPDAWRQAAERLPLAVREKELLRELACGLRGDEESVCKVITLVRERLEAEWLGLERRRQAEEKQLTAVCFSASALLVILLI